MKNLKETFAAILFFCAILSFDSCRKTDYAPNQPYTQNVMGSLVFRVVNGAGAPLRNANIAISKTREDAMHNIFMSKKSTNVDGIADFGELGAGTYYYKAEWTNTTHLETRDGLATISGNETTRITITFSHDNLADIK